MRCSRPFRNGISFQGIFWAFSMGEGLLFLELRELMKATGDATHTGSLSNLSRLYLLSTSYLHNLLPQCTGTFTFDQTFCFSINCSATWGYASLAIRHPVSAQVRKPRKEAWKRTQESYQSGRGPMGSQGSPGSHGRW